MKGRIRFVTFLLTLLTVLAVSAMWAVPVFADDEIPPPPETSEPAPPIEEGSGGEVVPAENPPEETPVEEAAPAESPAVDAPALEETAPTETPAEEAAPIADPAVDAPALEESAPPEVTVAEALSEVPEGTEVVVVNEEGEVVPLATEEAAQLIEVIDPIWCPTGVAPNPANPACSADFGSLQALVAGFVPTGNGVIWIEAGADGSLAPITIDGAANWSAAANFTLTLNGGWSGAYGSTTLNPNTPSVFSQYIEISNWNNAVTLNNITISGAAGVDALYVGTTKNIVLNNVDAVNNTGNGAFLDNTGPSGFEGTGTVTINSSTFNGNGGAGLIVYSNKAITAKNVSANDNAADGAYLNNNFYVYTPQAVTLSSVNDFNFNGGSGLWVDSWGAITLNNVTAVYNSGGYGVYLDNCLFDDVSGWCQGPGVAAVSLKGSSNFSNNGWDGLHVVGAGAITISSLTANDNGTDGTRPDETGRGAFLHNYGSYSPSVISITGTNTANGNAEAGLYLWSWGAVTVNNVTANENGQDVDCSPSWLCDGLNADTLSTFTLTGYGTFNGNGDDGLDAYGWNGVTLNNIYADGNDFWGAGVYSYKNITLLGTNVFTNNGDTGLFVESYGSYNSTTGIRSNGGVVTLNNVTANYNGSGVFVDNCDYNGTDFLCEVSAPKAVILKGVNQFNGNAGSGLVIYSSGAVTLPGVTANENDGFGVFISTCFNDGAGSCTGFPNQPVTLNGNNLFDGNLDDGLYVEASGAIKVNNLNSRFNGGNGAYLDNQWGGASGGLTLTGYGIFSSNGFLGLDAYSTGVITLSNITADYNGDVGASVDNDFNPLKPQSVSLLGVNQFNENYFDGLVVNSFGAITTNNLTANYNGDPGDPNPSGNGVVLENSLGTIHLPVTMNGINVFNGNYDDGLQITSLGAITIKQVTANFNGDRGAYVDNQFAIKNFNILISGLGVFNGNGSIGLEAYSNGNITTNGLTANFNNGGQAIHLGAEGGGVFFYNWSMTTTPVNILMNGVNTFNGNGNGISFTGTGLYALTTGTITISNLTANDNQEYGAYLDNCDPHDLLGSCVTLPKAITLNGFAAFVNNGLDGLFFNTNGAANLTRVTADFNGDDGVEGKAAGAITFTCGSMLLNFGSGYELTGSTVTLKGVFTYGNGLPNSSTPAAIITRACPLP